jgi:hypothetical protein
MSDKTPLLRNAPDEPSVGTPQEIAAWLEHANDALIARRNHLVEGAKPWLEIKRVDDDEAAGACAENVRMVNAFAKVAEARRTEQKQPFLEAERTVDGWHRALKESLQPALKHYHALLNAFAERKRADEQRRREDEARLAREEASRRAREAADAIAESDARNADAALQRAQEASQRAQDAQAAAHARPADLDRTRGSYGAVASTRRTWGYEVEDITQVPRSFLQVDADKVRAAMRDAGRSSDGRPLIDIPGIRWVAEDRIVVR